MKMTNHEALNRAIAALESLVQGGNDDAEAALRNIYKLQTLYHGRYLRQKKQREEKRKRLRVRRCIICNMPFLGMFPSCMCGKGPEHNR